MTTDAAGPREQAIRERLAWNKECPRPTPWKHSDEDVEHLLSVLDALRPEEPPPPKKVADLRAYYQSALAGHVELQNDYDKLSAEVASLRAQLTNEHAHVMRLLQDNAALEQQLRDTGAQLTEAHRERQRIHHDYCETLAALTEAQQARDIAQKAWNRLDIEKANAIGAWQKAIERAEAAEASLASLRQLPRFAAEWHSGDREPGTMVECVSAKALDAALAVAGPTPTPHEYDTCAICGVMRPCAIHTPTQEPT